MKTKLFGLAAWFPVVGCFLLLAGLFWDALLHNSHPELAEQENVFSLSNPSHLLAGIGIGLIVLGVITFLIKQAQELTKTSSLRGSLLIGVAFALLSLVTVNGYLLVQKNQNFVVPSEPLEDKVVQTSDYNELENDPRYAYYFSDNGYTVPKEARPYLQNTTNNSHSANDNHSTDTSSNTNSLQTTIPKPGETPLIYKSSNHSKRSNSK